MRRVAKLLLLSLALGITGGALADTFSIAGTLGSGGALNGTISLDPTSGFVSGIDLTVAADGQNFVFKEGSFMENHVGPLPSPYYAYFLYVTQNTQTDTSLDLVFPATLPFPGGDLCALTTPCANVQSSSFFDSFALHPATDNFETLVVTPVPTPEPRTLLYLLTGAAVGVLQQWRKRRVATRNAW